MKKILDSTFIQVFVLVNFIFIVILFNAHFFGCSTGWESFGARCAFDTPLNPIFLTLQGFIVAPFLLLFTPFAIFVIGYVLFLLLCAFKSSILVRGRLTRFTIFITLALFGVVGSIGNIINSNQHPYHWDVEVKGIDTSFIEFVQPDIFAALILFVPYVLFLLFVCFRFFRSNTNTI
jgi:hypothetical protein